MTPESAYALAGSAAAITAMVIFAAAILSYLVGKKVAFADSIQLRVTNRELMQRRVSLLKRLDEIASEATRLAVEPTTPEHLRIELQRFTALTEAQKELLT